MMEKTNKWIEMNNESIIQSIGNYIKTKRVDLNKSQTQLTEEAGVNRSTLSQIENGEPITLISLLQLLRALNALDVLNNFIVSPQLSPIALANIEQNKRQRASKKKSSNKPNSEW